MQRISDDLGLILVALGTFVITSVLAPLQRLHRGSLVAAAIFAFGAVLAVLSRLQSHAPSDRTRRLVATLALCSLLALVAGWLLRPDLVRHDSPADLVLLDTSQAMNGRLENGTKLDAAAGAVKKERVLTEQVGLATYGTGACNNGSPIRLRMPISQAGRSKLPSAVNGLRALGESNLVAAASRAVDELEPFKAAKRLLIFTGSRRDTCGDKRNEVTALNEVIQKAETNQVHVQWRIVGLGYLPEVPNSGDKVKVYSVYTPPELDEVVHQLLTIEPVTQEFKDLEGVLKTIRDDLNATIPAITARDYAQVDALSRERLRPHLESGTETFSGNKTSSGKISSERGLCESVTNFEHVQFKRLRDLIPHLDKVRAFDRDHRGVLSSDLERERNDLIDAWNAGVYDHNDKVEELNERVAQCLNELA